ncbi:MAG: M48 family metallopeptidase [Lentisphaeria bacterium]|nr:M48 family metallopeptidase [Lentisphaeria bacterium]
MPISEPFRIIRSPRRKHLAMRIDDDGVLEVLAPPRIPESLLRQAVAGESDAVARLRWRFTRPEPPDFSENASFMLLGTPYPLRLTRRLRLFDHGFLIPDGDAEEKKNALTALYRDLAKSLIPPRVAMFREHFSVQPEKVSINAASTRWGSCSAWKTLSFSWKLIQCPPDTVDYVVVHELSHLEEMNHSPAFWRRVASVLPDYAARRAKLRAFARALPRW